VICNHSVGASGLHSVLSLVSVQYTNAYCAVISAVYAMQKVQLQRGLIVTVIDIGKPRMDRRPLSLPPLSSSPLLSSPLSSYDVWGYYNFLQRIRAAQFNVPAI